MPWLDRDGAKAELQHPVARDPRLVLPCPDPDHGGPTCPFPVREPDPPRSRWTLSLIQEVCVWLQDHPPQAGSGVWRVLRSLDTQWQRGRQHVHSPDPDYLAKLARVTDCQALVREDPSRSLLLFQDEVTDYRQPTVAQAYAPAGRVRLRRTERSHGATTTTRVVATLDWLTGQVTALQAPRIGVQQLVRFYEALCQQHPAARRIYLVQDNWPVHFHPDVLVALAPQENPFPFPRPPHWLTEPSPAAQRRWGGLALPIQLVTLPTYASWTNPIEKLWRWLKHDVLHHHPWAHDLAELRRQVLAFLATFADGSPALLRYVGLHKLAAENTASGIPP